MNDSIRICPTQLEVGDVILSVGGDRLAKIVAKKSDCEYTHASVVFDAQDVVVAHMSNIPVFEDFSRFRSRFLHHAVFRQIAGFSESQAVKFNAHISTVVKLSAPYDTEGLKAFVKNQDKHLGSVIAKINDYYTQGCKPSTPHRDSYHCAQFVASCFVASGHLKDGVEVALEPDFTSVADLGDKGAYGGFVGFIEGGSDSSITDEDRFANAATISEIRSPFQSNIQKS